MSPAQTVAIHVDNSEGLFKGSPFGKKKRKKLWFPTAKKQGSWGRPPKPQQGHVWGHGCFPIQIPPAEISGIFTLEVHKKNQKQWHGRKHPHVFGKDDACPLKHHYIEEILKKKKPSNMFSSFEPEGWCFF